ncbi:MAG: C39 family peptidase [Clostridia bacterium]|nr:C39 family peptidase [Clostridia bacterium]
MILVVSTTVTVMAATTTLSIPRVQQAKSKWCWAACSEMVGQYMNSDSSRDQWDVVKHIKGSSYPNKGGTSSEIERSIKYVTKDMYTASTSRSPLSFSRHKSDINNSEPLIVWMSWDSSGAHVVVASGYNDTSDKLRLTDPASTSISYYPYDDLVNGTTIETGTGKYTRTIYID